MKRRVVVTGMGVVSPIGIGVEEFKKALFSGKSGVRRITLFDPSSYRSQIAGEVRDFDPRKYLSPKEIKRMDRFTQFGMVAAEEAIRQAGINFEEEDTSRMGVLVGSGVGGLSTIEREEGNLLRGGPQKVSPFLVPMLITDIASAQVAIRYRLSGPNLSISTACATGNHSIGEAFRVIQRGEADLMIAGGAEAAITPLGLAGFCSMRALSTRNEEPEKASRPFDRERDGFVIGEGAGVVVLEELNRARKRGATILGEIIGFGMTADAYHITQPIQDGRGIKEAMLRALKDAGVSPQEVDYINAHGTSTPLNDRIETQAIKDLFGEHAYRVPVSSTKSMTGHLLGATGGVELIACLLALNEGVIPPTINYENPDPECDLDYVPNKARKLNIKIALSNSMGFGGHNAVLIVKKYEE
ncbi:beta-ketoacyl-[acyl-carrier-protein] synthase II [Candidatus Aerophobetes bacterium]|uniref:3-oxoacyl-[acyl-carrier-protein] synthase 2 n=1 Tax=Aerophobetes bacterium TaxID=2030807 RepID=A0A497E759_UNCAE|nr:beta-ketoacyl-ACP synthase II [Candidatus Aerophobetes bacterium]RLE10881.1 MAG: beta-ketoacyl-[acyl-carrier-protein] synthase II [Candidatus Aerophobetes bacterium]